MKKMTIKSWAIDDRPREKLIAKGARSLSTAELIAILISSGNKEESAVDLSKRILLSLHMQEFITVVLLLTSISLFSQTDSLKAGRYVYDVELSFVDSDGATIIERVLEGKITLTPSVTR